MDEEETWPLYDNSLHTQGDFWGAYWRKVGLPTDERAAEEWRRNPGPFAGGMTKVGFFGAAPPAVQEVIKRLGWPSSWAREGVRYL